MSAGALHKDQSRALSAGLDVATTVVIDMQVRLADMRSAEAV
ncbi:hypothetical protein [Paracoccus beibuensis]|nr:hypothetical protein [Paracoccus beibuensis]